MHVYMRTFVLFYGTGRGSCKGRMARLTTSVYMRSDGPKDLDSRRKILHCTSDLKAMDVNKYR